MPETEDGKRRRGEKANFLVTSQVWKFTIWFKLQLQFQADESIQGWLGGEIVKRRAVVPPS